MVLKPSYTELEEKIESLQEEIDTLSGKQKKLQQSNDFLNAVFENRSEYIVFKDLDSRILKFNKQYQEMQFHLTKTYDLLGKNNFDLFSEDQALRVNEIEQQVMEGRKPFVNRDVKMVSSHGEEMVLLESQYPVQDKEGHVTGLAVIGHNITAQKITEKALWENEERFRILMESAPLAIMSIDPSGRIIDLNSKIVELMNSPSAEETRKINILTFPPLIEQGISADFKHCLETSKSGVFEHSYLTKWKKRVYMRYYLSPVLNHDNVVIGCQAIIEDFSKWKEAEQELHELHEQARKDADTKALLLNEVNHRVKNNLSSIIGMLYTTQRFIKQAGNQVDYMLTISDLINRIEGLATVHNMLSASRWSSVTLKDLTQRIIYSALQSLSPDKKIDVQIEANDDLMMSPRRANDLGMIINELTTNTIKHGMVNRNRGRIQVNIIRQDNDIVFEFKNDGMGYPENVLSQNTHNVGIYLIKTIVNDVLGGTLTLHNDKGALARIRFGLNE